jgi:hypothetical protein
MTVDLTSLPPYLGVNVARVDPDTGKPTKATLDNELAERQVLLDSLGDLQGQIVLAQASADDASAAVTLEADARADADSAQADLITTVTATANGATASGKVFLGATSNLAGTSATYAWYLTANGSVTGMYATADGAGGGGIAFTASRFMLTDPSYQGGAPRNVFNYDGAAFAFNVPVIIRTGDINPQAVSRSRVVTGTGANLSLPIFDLVGGSQLLILVLANVTAGYSAASIPTLPYVQIVVDGVLQRQTYAGTSLDTRTTAVTVNTVTGASTSVTNQVWWQMQPGICAHVYDVPGSGLVGHTITAQWHPSSTPAPPAADWTMIIQELKR